MPHLALPALSSYLRSHGVEVIQRDSNLEVFESVRTRRIHRAKHRSPAGDGGVPGLAPDPSAAERVQWALAEGPKLAVQVEQAVGDHAQSGLSGWPDRIAGPLDDRSEPRRCFAALLPGFARSAQVHAARARGQQPQPAPVRPRRAAQHVPGHLPPRHPPRHRARAAGHRRHLDPDGGSDAGRR